MPKPARWKRALPGGCGRHGHRYNKTPRLSETATIHAGTSRTLPSFQMIMGKPRCRSSIRFLRVARRWACDATRTSGDILFSGIGFSLPVRFAFIRVFGGLTQIQVRFGKMPKPARWKRALPRDFSAETADSRSTLRAVGEIESSFLFVYFERFAFRRNPLK